MRQLGRDTACLVERHVSIIGYRAIVSVAGVVT